jgi:hypothetical protein
MSPSLDDLAMQRSLPVVTSWILGLSTLLLLGCASPAFWPQFTDTLFDSPSDGVCRIAIRNGQLLSYSAPVRAEDIPEKVRLTMDELREGGRTVYLAREWGPDGPAYRVDELVRIGDKDERRSLLVNDDGHVIGRSYEISLANAPNMLLEHATTAGFDRNAIRSVRVVLGPAGDKGHYRMLIEDRQGRQRMLECRADGGMVTWSRVIQAQVTSTR